VPAQQSSANDWDNPAAEVPNLSISALSVDPAADSAQSTIWQTSGLIGPYRLLERIGSGGMGEVWSAEQTQPVRRLVALKLIKAGMDTSEVVARFKSERQALALMDHPNIAKVFDAGSTPLGRPYFVMEYITGTPITQYCDQHKMTVRQRLELFVQLCDAVQHAHQKAIIHRDLKPSNILVSEVDCKPLPRIIDFGVAKAMSHSLTAETQYTQTGAILGTPAYMSPEQASSVGLDVDTRTDVYSLGVVLYELLVGARPLDLQNLTFDEILRHLREEESPRPSTKLRTLGEDSSTTAENRSSDPPTLLRQLRGDLDAIALKALEKDRSRRYGSPSDLAADLGRYLRSDAVLAVPPSLLYRAGKFARRYRRPLIGVAACVVMLMLASGVSIWQSIRATKQRDRADAEAATAQAISDFLQKDLLAQASTQVQLMPSTKANPDLKVRTVLDRAAARIAGRFDRQPEVEAAIRETIGRTYLDLGLYRQGANQFARVLDLHRRALGTENAKTLSTASLVASFVAAEGRYADAVVLLTQVLNTQRRVLGPGHPDTLLSMSAFAKIYLEQGKYPQAEALLRQLSQLGRRVWGPESTLTLTCMDRLADVYYRQGKYRQAEELDNQVLATRRRVLGPEHPDTTVSMSELANVYSETGRFSDAEALYRQILEIRRRQMGPEHAFTLAAMNNLAIACSNEGKYEEAERLDSQALEIRRRVLGREYPETLMSMENLACDYSDRRKYSQAEALFGQALEIDRRVMGIESRLTLSTLSDAAMTYQREGKYALAEKYAAEVLAAQSRALGTESSVTMEAAASLVTARLSQRKFAETEPLSREVLEFYRKNQPEDWQRFRAESLLGAILAGQKKYTEAAPLLLEGYQGMLAQKNRITAPDRYHLDQVRKWIVQLHRAVGKQAKDAKPNEK
jgi:non-specific serine/threonine protein kinase/serine/threonine-protein kinase